MSSGNLCSFMLHATVTVILIKPKQKIISRSESFIYWLVCCSSTLGWNYPAHAMLCWDLGQTFCSLVSVKETICTIYTFLELLHTLVGKIPPLPFPVWQNDLKTSHITQKVVSSNETNQSVNEVAKTEEPFN